MIQRGLAGAVALAWRVETLNHTVDGELDAVAR